MLHIVLKGTFELLPGNYNYLNASKYGVNINKIINKAKYTMDPGISYIVKFSLSVGLFVSMLVQNRLQNHAYYSDEAFAGDSVGLGLGQRLNFISKKGTFGAKSPLV